jgi:transglutaminase-like putative cysteine protease
MTHSFFVGRNMQYSITHRTLYQYSVPVTLRPHILRLRPRSDSGQILETFSLCVEPNPAGRSDYLDFDGNNLTKIWFDSQSYDQLEITVCSTVVTTQENPFNYVLDAEAVQLPIDYPTSILQQLNPYLTAHTLDPVAVTIAQDLLVQYDYDVLQFLSQLNQLIHRECDYSQREFGPPQPPGITWRDRRGSCRDFGVLFMAVCRAVGLATRFVSGYQEGDLNLATHDLHAWVEVYLLGAGWRGYDPTLGLVVSDRHIALISAPTARQTLPIEGAFWPVVAAELVVDVTLTAGELGSHLLG